MPSLKTLTPVGAGLTTLWSLLGIIASSYGDDLKFTPNVSIEKFQKQQEALKPYDFDAPPQGMFRIIEMAEGFDLIATEDESGHLKLVG
jgi:hypothetical protein